MSQQTDSQGPPTAVETRRWWIKLMIQPALCVAAGVLVIVALGAAQRLGWISASGGARATTASQDSTARYICPMMCTPPQTVPGRCPVCAMELVVAAGGAQDMDELAVRIEPAARRLANIKTVSARQVPLARKIRAVGEIAYDEGALATIAAYVDGRVEKLFADYTGVRVRPGDELALLYSPELYSAQVEFVQSKRAWASSGRQGSARVADTRRAILDGVRQKLLELGMTEGQVQELERSGEAKSRIHISAPIGGTVIEKLADQGQYVKTGDPIYRIADLSTVWLMLKLFPEDVASIRYGQRVEAEVQSLPGRKFTGRVAFIDPTVSPKTRTVGVRVVMDNGPRMLRVGDYATADIEVQLTAGSDDAVIYDPDMAGKWISPRHPHVVQDEPGKCRVCGIELVPTSRFGFASEPVASRTALVVPRSAVLMAGRSSVAYVESEPGRFEIRPLVLGPLVGDDVVVLKGITAGEMVATAGNFLIDSQMQLAGKPSLIDPARALRRKPGPLVVRQIDVEPITGSAGAELEGLYQAYFAVQAGLAVDTTITRDQAESLQSAARRLSRAYGLPESLRPLTQTIADSAARLDELSLDEARLRFKPISKAAIQLAAKARGEAATDTFLHFYCSMVKDGQGDWLQCSRPLANPYWGSKMLRCGKEIHRLPIAGPPASDDPSPGEPTVRTARRPD